MQTKPVLPRSHVPPSLPPLAISTTQDESDDEEEEEEDGADGVEDESDELATTQLADEEIASLSGILDSLQNTYDKVALLSQNDNMRLEEVFRGVESKNLRVEDMLHRMQAFVGNFSQTLGTIAQSRADMLTRVERLERLEHIDSIPESLEEESSTTATSEAKKGGTLDRKPTRAFSTSRKSIRRPTTQDDQQGPSLSGTLTVSVLSAAGIKACDPTGFSDPYCILRVGRGDKLEKVARTSTIIQTLSPVWQETFKLQIRSATHLGIKCKDWDRFSQDDTCGDVFVDLLLHFNQERKEEKDFTLPFDTQGTITLHIKFEPMDR